MCVSSLPWGGVGQTRTPQFLPEISGLFLARGWTENFPPQSEGGGVAPPSLPSSFDCPPVFRVGVLVTANMCMGLAGWWGSSPFFRAVKPRERGGERERERVQAIPFLDEMIEEGSSLLKWHSFRGLRIQPLNLPWRGGGRLSPNSSPTHTPGFLCGGEPRRSKLWCERVGEMLGVGVLVF